MSATPKPVPPSVNGWNAEYLEAQHQRWRDDPASVPPDLQQFFAGFDLALNGAATRIAAQAASPTTPGSVARVAPLGLLPLDERDRPSLPTSAAVSRLMFHYRDVGHLCASLDPFGRERPSPDELSPNSHGLAESSLDLRFDASPFPMEGPASLREIIAALDETYCRSVGAEFMHVQDAAERVWLAERMETCRNHVALSAAQRVHVMWQLFKAESFEKFLHTRYPGEKRFSIEGAESLIPLLDRLVETAAESGVEEIVLGMAHRGRLNVLNNIIGKTHEQIFTEFEDNWEEDFVDGGGDVKYHRGYSGERTTTSGKTIWLALASNPSHLESVDAVVEGRARAKQRARADSARERVVPLLIHGDAAVIAQGVVAEVLNLSRLKGYETGGTIHVVVNNLIGFTTGEEDARSTRYCTDIAKMIEAPILHVNGEDPEACVHVAQVAFEYRQRFKKDVFIDMWCYRRWGHNESDEPSFTQPVMYSLIRNKPSVLTRYAERLLAEGVIGQKDVDEIRDGLQSSFDKAQAASKAKPFDPTIDPGSRKWQGFDKAYSHAPTQTGVAIETLREIAGALGRTPDGFNVNRKLKALLQARAASCESEDSPIDYATAESLAYGTLLLEGTHVRLTGQDSRRGTFSHRHAVLRDAETAEPYVPLNHIRERGRPGTSTPAGEPGADGRPRQSDIAVYDSPLSEEACVGFEYGYSLVDPHALVLWEAQFGDFCNGAQVYFDQYLAAAEAKWQRWSGLVLLLPHGYEGAGPEHSSARMERFLQLCGDDNIQVVHPSTAAQVFHMLRRQVRRPFRKPLVVMTPKSMLRVPTSTVADLVRGRFEEIIDDPRFASGADRSSVRRLVLCSGKIYHELAARRDESGCDDVAIIRVEQLYPFHKDLAREIFDAYPRTVEVVWAQEEPQNAGAYRFIEPILRERLGVERVGYIGRDISSTPAVGSKTVHKDEQEAIVALAVSPAKGESLPAKLPEGVLGAPLAPREPSARSGGRGKAAVAR